LKKKEKKREFFVFLSELRKDQKTWGFKKKAWVFDVTVVACSPVPAAAAASWW